MAVRYLFNTAGEYVAFLQGENIFSPDCEWLGFVRDGNLYYSIDGTFRGYVLEDDRIARNKTESLRPYSIVPLKPLRPLRPPRPLRRLRRPKLPYPFADFFEHGIQGIDAETSAASETFSNLLGCKLIGADNVFLGFVTQNKFESNSLTNSYGPYGSPYSSTSIFNNFSPYGSPYSPTSPFNEYSRTPPRFERDNVPIAYLTKNQFVSPRVDPAAFIKWIKPS